MNPDALNPDCNWLRNPLCLVQQVPRPFDPHATCARRRLSITQLVLLASLGIASYSKSLWPFISALGAMIAVHMFVEDRFMCPQTHPIPVPPPHPHPEDVNHHHRHHGHLKMPQFYAYSRRRRR